MKKLYVGFSRSRKKFAVGSTAIRIYQGFTEYSHVYLKTDSPKFPSGKYIHASEGKVQCMSGTQFHKRHQIIKEFSIKVDDTTYEMILKEMHEASGDDYGFMQNVGILYVDLMRELFKKRVKNPWQRGFNCSEFVMFILQKIYPISFQNYDRNTITPKDIYKVLSKLSLNQPRVVVEYGKS